MDAVIGKNVRRLRLERAWTQETLAQASKVPVRTIQRAEAGKHIQLETLLAFAGAFDVTPEDLRKSPPANPESEHLEAVLEIITSFPADTSDSEIEARLREHGCSEAEIRRGIDARRAALKFEIFHLQPISSGADFGPLLSCHSSLSDSSALENDDQRDRFAELEQAIMDLNDLWPELGPVDRRAMEKSLNEQINALRAEGIAVAAGVWTRRLKEPHGNWQVLVIVASQPDKLKRMVLLDRRKPLC